MGIGNFFADVGSIFRKIFYNRRLRLLFFFGAAFFGGEILAETFFHAFLEANIWLKFLVRFLGGMAEICILSMFFGMFFDYNERRELINEAAQKFGFLGELSNIGIRGFEPDSKNYDHKKDFEESDDLEIFVFGSPGFFQERFDLIKNRLKSGKRIKIVVHESKSDGLKKLFELFKAYGLTNEISEKIIFFTQPIDPNYNYVKTGKGIWIKGYFLNYEADYGAPAFFIEKDTKLYTRYMEDIAKIVKTELSGSDLDKFVEQGG